MPLSESDTRAKLIDPALHSPGWTEDLIRREEAAGAVEIVDGKPHKRSQGRTDYTLRIKVTSEAQPVAVALIEAKAENLPATHGLEQAKLYAESKRLNVPFVIATNGHSLFSMIASRGSRRNQDRFQKSQHQQNYARHMRKGWGFRLSRRLPTVFSGDYGQHLIALRGENLDEAYKGEFKTP